MPVSFWRQGYDPCLQNIFGDMARGSHLLYPYIWLALVLAALVAAIFILWVPSAGAGDAVEIDRCGQSVGEGRRAYLSADLDCRGLAGEGVVLADGARLDLAGHWLLGEPEPAGGIWQGVRCKAGGRCTVAGPGLITGFSASGVAGTRVRIIEVELSGNGRAGVAAYQRVRMRDSVVRDNGTVGVLVGRRFRSRRSEIGNHPDGRLLEVRPPPSVCRVRRSS